MFVLDNGRTRNVLEDLGIMEVQDVYIHLYNPIHIYVYTHPIYTQYRLYDIHNMYKKYNMCIIQYIYIYVLLCFYCILLYVHIWIGPIWPSQRKKTWRSHHDISADAVFFYPRLGAQGQSSQTQQRHLRRLRSPALRLHQGAGRSWAFIMMFHNINRCVEYITIFIIEMNIISII